MHGQLREKRRGIGQEVAPATVLMDEIQRIMSTMSLTSISCS